MQRETDEGGTMSVYDRLKELGIVIPAAPLPVAAYVPAVVSGEYAFTAGQIPFVDGKVKYVGKVGAELAEEDGYASAQVCALNCLAVLQTALGDLDRVERILKVTVFVNSTPDFTKSPAVANGASEFFVNVFGENGQHARSAVGVSSLPLNAATEVEVIAKVHPA